MTTFFCDPHSPWQKGQVERTNRTIRMFLDKKRPLSEIDDDEILQVQNAINALPKRVLDFKTPQEVYTELFGCTSP